MCGAQAPIDEASWVKKIVLAQDEDREKWLSSERGGRRVVSTTQDSRKVVSSKGYYGILKSSYPAKGHQSVHLTGRHVRSSKYASITCLRKQQSYTFECPSPLRLLSTHTCDSVIKSDDITRDSAYQRTS